jgi:cytochrome c oxidase subunit 1
MTRNPPKPHNFDQIPSVHSIDEFFHRKYDEDEETGKLVKVATAEEVLAEFEAHPDPHMHMPGPSYWPIVVAFGFPLMGLGIIYNHIISVVGALVVLAGIYGWTQEPSVPDPEDEEPPSGGSKELATVG